MSNLLIKQPDLFKDRKKDLKEILKPLSDKKKLFCHFSKSVLPDKKALAAHGGTSIETDFRYWKFPSFIKGIWCKYYEIWQQHNDNFHWFLCSAYLDILLINKDRDFEKIVCLHCEPNDNSNTPLRFYKQSPHIHVKKSTNPIPKCHFPLNLGNLDQVLSSIDDLNKAFIDAIDILRLEVIDRFKEVI